jgi:hypothetical protein
VRWQGATTLQATACKEEQRRQRAPRRLNRVRSALTQAVSPLKETKVSIHAGSIRLISDQLPFLG